MATAITNFKSLIIIMSLLPFTISLSLTDNTAIDIKNEKDTTSMKTLINESIYDQSRKPSDSHNFLYETMKDYFLQFKRTIHVKLKNAQPNTTDDTIEFQSWTLSIIALVAMSSIFICCFIPLLFCLACKLFGCCACTGCKACL
ncbi:putative integral membrane protein [Acanthocheilonema viteae]